MRSLLSLLPWLDLPLFLYTSSCLTFATVCPQTEITFTFHPLKWLTLTFNLSPFCKELCNYYSDHHQTKTHTSFPMLETGNGFCKCCFCFQPPYSLYFKMSCIFLGRGNLTDKQSHIRTSTWTYCFRITAECVIFIGGQSSDLSFSRAHHPPGCAIFLKRTSKNDGFYGPVSSRI